MNGRISFWALSLLILLSGNSEAHRNHETGEGTGHYVAGIYAVGKHIDRFAWQASCEFETQNTCIYQYESAAGWAYKRGFTWLSASVSHCPLGQTLQNNECAPSNTCQLPDIERTIDTNPQFVNFENCLFELSSFTTNQDGTFNVIYQSRGWEWADHDNFVGGQNATVGNTIAEVPDCAPGYEAGCAGGAGGGEESCRAGQRSYISWAYTVASDADKVQFCLSNGCRAVMPTDSGGSVDAICLGLAGEPNAQCVAEVVLNGQECTAGGAEGDTDTDTDNSSTGGTVVNVDNSGVESRLDTLIAQGEAAAAGGDCDPAITPGCAGGTGTIPSTTGAESFGVATQGFYDGISSGPWGTALSGSYSTSGAAADCPTAEFDWVDGTPMVVDFHCTLIEDSKPVIASAFLFLWTFVAVRTLFSA